MAQDSRLDVARRAQCPLMKKHAIYDVGVPNMIQGMFLDLGVLGSLGNRHLVVVPEPEVSNDRRSREIRHTSQDEK